MEAVETPKSKVYRATGSGVGALAAPQFAKVLNKAC